MSMYLIVFYLLESILREYSTNPNEERTLSPVPLDGIAETTSYAKPPSAL
jgi:hypothetical protein